MFRSLRHRLDPLDREILERTFDATLAAVKGDNVSVECDSDHDLEALLQRELIEIACLTGVNDPVKLQDILLGRILSIKPAPTAG